MTTGGSARTNVSPSTREQARSGVFLRRSRPRQRLFSTAVALSLFLLDAAVLSGAAWLAANLHDLTGKSWAGDVVPGDDYPIIATFTIIISLASFLFGGIYSRRRGISRIDDAAAITVRVTIASLAAIALTSLVAGSGVAFSRRVVIAGWALSVLGVVTTHFVHTGLIASLRSNGIGTDRLLIVGAGPTGALVIEKLRRSPQLGYEIAGVVRHRPWGTGGKVDRLEGIPMLGMSSELRDIVEKGNIDEIIVAMSGTSHDEILDLLMQIDDLPVAVRIYPDSFRLLTSDVLSIHDLNGLPTVQMRTIGLRPFERSVKRSLDITVSALVLVAFAPLMVLVAMLIKLTSPGPVFFTQERVGQDGRAFLVLKFRTMGVDAEDDSGPVFTTPGDTRPTRLGRFLRRYSIDELPQFINVLYGEMSVVGPRPERPFFVEQFRRQIPAYMARHHEKSGITGWAQVNGLRGDTSIEERTRYDLYYVENWSLMFDIKIMVKTLFHIFQRDSNAY